VLLSCVDHYNRVALNTQKRVVGILLGETYKGRVEVTNSYAVPFEEDDKNSKIWFLDHNYHETMHQMYKKVSAKELIVGWYSTGPKMKENDLAIHQVIARYHPHPVLVIVDVQDRDELDIPTKSFITVDEVLDDGTTRPKFKHIASEIGAVEAEEVGVEHLLRDVKDTSISTLATRINAKLASVKSLLSKLHEMQDYLEAVRAGQLPVNHTIISNIQEIFNLLPNLSVESLVEAFAIKTNDMLLLIYLSSLIRSIIALHNLIRNKIELGKKERLAEGTDDKDAKDKEAKDQEKADKADKDKDKDADTSAAAAAKDDAKSAKKRRVNDGKSGQSFIRHPSANCEGSAVRMVWAAPPAPGAISDGLFVEGTAGAGGGGFEIGGGGDSGLGVVAPN